MIIVILSMALLVSLVVIIYLGLVIRTQLIKERTYIEELDKYDEYVVEYQSMLKQTYDKLKDVDDRNLFAKDDDVGFVFSDILNIIEEISKKSDIVTDASADKSDK